MGWMEDGRKVLAAAIVFAVVVFAWVNRYQVVNQVLIKNRITGAVCHPAENCW